jgi:ABC-type transport system substrate-binding protein
MRKLMADIAETADPAAKKKIYMEIARLLTDRGGQNRMRYCNPKIDQWTIEAEETNDKALKLELFSKIQKEIAEDLPQIYLWYSANVIVASSRVGNLNIDQYGSWYFIPKLTLTDQ